MPVAPSIATFTTGILPGPAVTGHPGFRGPATLPAVLSLPGYETIDVLGRGGFGVVYRARQLNVDREVAIKADSRGILDDRDQRRFLREVRAAGRLSRHPNVVEIYDAGVLADRDPYLAVE